MIALTQLKEKESELRHKSFPFCLCSPTKDQKGCSREQTHYVDYLKGKKHDSILAADATIYNFSPLDPDLYFIKNRKPPKL